MNILRRLTKQVLLAPVDIVKGSYDAIDEVVNGPYADVDDTEKKQTKPVTKRRYYRHNK